MKNTSTVSGREAFDPISYSEDASLVAKEDEVVTVVMAPDGSIEETSGPVKTILGYDPEHLAGSPMFRYVNDRDLLKVFTTIAELISGYERKAEVDLNIKTADGRWRAFRASAQLRLKERKMIGIMVTLYPLVTALAG